jgi:hypothetical protein
VIGGGGAETGSVTGGSVETGNVTGGVAAPFDSTGGRAAGCVALIVWVGGSTGAALFVLVGRDVVLAATLANRSGDAATLGGAGAGSATGAADTLLVTG